MILPKGASKRLLNALSSLLFLCISPSFWTCFTCFLQSTLISAETFSFEVFFWRVRKKACSKCEALAITIRRALNGNPYLAELEWRKPQTLYGNKQWNVTYCLFVISVSNFNFSCLWTEVLKKPILESRCNFFLAPPHFSLFFVRKFNTSNKLMMGS